MNLTRSKRLRALMAACLVSAVFFIYRFESAPPGAGSAAGSSESSNERAEAIREAYMHSWKGYRTYAFGSDELLPLSKKGGDSQSGWGATIVDGLSTAIMMELQDVVDAQLKFINTVDFTKSKSRVSLFETTIRYLGGLISAYDLLNGPYQHLVTPENSGSVQRLIVQAKSLADSMKFAFNTTTGVPYGYLNITSGDMPTDQTNSVAGVGTLVLEWQRLSDISGDRSYGDLAQIAQAWLLHPHPSFDLGPQPVGEPFPGLLGSWVSIGRGHFTSSNGGWGAFGDSFYEYLLKMYIYDPVAYSDYKDRWVLAADSTIKYLSSRSASKSELMFVGEFRDKSVLKQSEHLVCFIGGNFLLGGEVLGRSDYEAFGLELVKSCHAIYASSPDGIGPETFSWESVNVPGRYADFYNENGWYPINMGYKLRPETIESYYYAWKVTGNPMYKEWAWEAFVAINKSCRNSNGYSSTDHGGKVGIRTQTDFQESFWFAEVLKYLYLIFKDDVVVGVTRGTQKWVFNTEAHPFKTVERV